MTMTGTVPSLESAPPARESTPMKRYLDLLPLRSEFDDVFQFFLLVKLLMARTPITPSQLVKLLLEHRLTGLTLEHLAVKHNVISFMEALDLLTERRRVMDGIAGSAA